MGLGVGPKHRSNRIEARPVRVPMSQGISRNQPGINETDLGPIPESFEVTKVLAEASLHGVVQLEVATPPAEPRDATIFDDYDALKEGY